MPLERRLQVLEAHIKRAHVAYELETVDLYSLGRDEQHVILDALVKANDDLPATLVHGIVVCVGGLDVEAIAAAVRRAGSPA